MSDLRRRTRTGARAGALAVLTAGWLGLAELDVARHPAPQKHAAFERHAIPWARTALRTLGTHLHLAGESGTGTHVPRLVVANHRTTLDVLVLMSIFGGHFLSRGDLAGWPLVGRAATSAGAVFVDRDDRRSGATAIRKLRTLLREGRTLIVFPEGTTYRGDEVRPFLPGAFAAVRDLDVAVVPVGLAYPEGTEWWHESFGSHAQRLVGRKRTDVGVCIGAEQRPQGMRPRDLAAVLRDEVQSLVGAARALVPE